MEAADRNHEIDMTYDLMPCGVVVASRSTEGEIRLINTEFTSITGYTHEDLPTVRSWLERAYPDPEYRALVLANWDRDVSEPGRDVVYRVRCADGSDKELLLRAGLAGANEMVVTAQDLSGMRRVERELRASEQKYRILYERSWDAIMTLAPPSWRFTSGNPATIQMFGAEDEEDFVSRPPWELSPELQPDGRPSPDKAKEMIETAMREGSYFFEWTHTRCSGEDFPATVLLTRIEIAGGPMLQATVRDITERKRAEEELKTRVALEALVSRISADLVVLSLEHVDSGIEKALEAITRHAGGVRASIFLCSDDKTLYTNTHEWCADAADSQIDQLQEIPADAFGYYDQQLQQHRNIAITRLEDLPVEAAAREREWSDQHGFRPLLFVPMVSSGGLRGALGVYGGVGQPMRWSDDFVDMLRFVADTVLQLIERKRSEADNAALEQRLHQSQKMEAIGRLAGGVAHDFNNMLCATMSNTELALLSMSTMDPLREPLEEILEVTQRATALTQQLLVFSRKQFIEPKVLDLSAVIRKLHPMLTRLIGEDIVMRTVPQRGLGRVRADPGQIEQIVLNLAINARDAMPDGGGLLIETADIVLDVQPRDALGRITPGAYVVLSVSDTGVGVEAEIREKIFEPFFTTKQPGQGTGLGLATVFGIVEQSGGMIELRSEPGAGASFKVYFPRVSDEGENDDPAATEPHLGDETVLVVEDDAKVRRPAVKLLQQRGYEVLEAGSGDEAMNLSERHAGQIDLLVTDVVMPHMSGRELADRLTQQRPEIRILYTSGYPQGVIGHRNALDEDLNFMAKPYTYATLCTRVRDVLDQKDRRKT